MSERSVFLAALDLADVVQRRDYLAEACGEDDSLRGRVEELIQAHEQPGEFMQQPAAAMMPTVNEPPGAEAPGTVIGPYKLLERIGSGGFGDVYLAEQTRPVRRKVALKFLKPGMDSREIVARFEAERQALALMDHPNIAKVLDGGTTPSGRPFFVMELVRGVPITEYCDRHQLTPQQRLELFVPVCQAVQHAHQKGIIHRDLKPSNVLVSLLDTTAAPKVIDFGVAKALGQELTDKTLYTGFAQMIGTPLYMSPEQAGMSGLDTDTRSDIYALGVLLYELLTGTTPIAKERFKQAAYDEIRRIIREEDPPKPSTRLSELSSPHAPRAEPGSGTSNVPTTLASVAAQRQTEPAKLTRLVRGELDWIVMKCLEKDRNRRYETANGLALDVQRYLHDEHVLACPPSAAYRFSKFARRNKAAIAFTGLVLLILLTLTGGIGWNVRDRAATQANVQREVELAIHEVERFEGQGKWQEALSAVKRAQGLLAAGGSQELHERIRQLREDLELILRLEEIPLLVTEVKDSRFDFQSGDQAYAKTFADSGIDVATLPAEEAVARIRARNKVVALALVAALDDWAHVRNQKDQAGGWALAKLAHAADPDPWRQKVRNAQSARDKKMLAALAASPELLRQPPTSLRMLVRALGGVGETETAVAVMRRARQEYPNDFWTNFELANYLHQLKPPRWAESTRYLTAAAALRPKSPGIYFNLGLLLAANGDREEAAAAYREAIRLKPDYSLAHTNLGDALRAQGKPEEALECYRRVIELDPKNAGAHTGLGQFLETQHKPDEALAAFREGARLGGPVEYFYLGQALVMRGQDEEALTAFREAARRDEPRVGQAIFKLGELLRKLGRNDEAVATFRRARELAEAELRPDDVQRAEQALAGALAAQARDLEIERKPDEALAALREAARLGGPVEYFYLGQALVTRGQDEEALTAFREAARRDEPHVGEAIFSLGELLRKLGRNDESVAAFRRARELAEAEGRPDQVQRAGQALAGALAAPTGRFRE